MTAERIQALEDTPRVLRGGEVVVVDGQAYNLRALVKASYAMVKELGSKNPGFDMPPWFFSGSPYAEQIKALGVQPIPIPENFTAEYLPQSTPGWSRRPPIWQHTPRSKCNDYRTHPSAGRGAAQYP